MTDIAFSIDSILAAVAMAESFPSRFGDNGRLFIVFVGGVLGIITMRFVVRYFLILLDRFPGLAEGAYWLVAWIGSKLTISGFYDAKYLGHHIPEWLFWLVMLLIAVVSMVITPRVKPQDAAIASESLDLLESEDQPTTDEPESGPNPSHGPNSRCERSADGATSRPDAAGGEDGGRGSRSDRDAPAGQPDQAQDWESSTR